LEENQESVIGTDGVSILNQIVISDLLQMGHPGYRLLKQQSKITPKQLPTFLDYVSLIYQRFKYYINEESHGNMEYGNYLIEIMEALKTLTEEDEPAVVIPVREKLKSLLPHFEEECKSMGKCFTSPPFVKEFYTELAEMVNESAHEVMGPVAEVME